VRQGRFANRPCSRRTKLPRGGLGDEPADGARHDTPNDLPYSVNAPMHPLAMRIHQ